jgi:hypothetical protein
MVQNTLLYSQKQSHISLPFLPFVVYFLWKINQSLFLGSGTCRIVFVLLLKVTSVSLAGVEEALIPNA